VAGRCGPASFNNSTREIAGTKIDTFPAIESGCYNVGKYRPREGQNEADSQIVLCRGDGFGSPDG
jgi:hypothetical protein